MQSLRSLHWSSRYSLSVIVVVFFLRFFSYHSLSTSVSQWGSCNDGNGGDCRQERRGGECFRQEPKSAKYPTIPKGRSCSSSVWETTTIPSQFTSTTLIFRAALAGRARIIPETLVANTRCCAQRGFGLLPVIGLTSTLMITWEVITSSVDVLLRANSLLRS